MKRHNEAMEELSKARDEWYEKTVEKKNKIALLGQRLIDANKDLDATNEALHNLRTAMDEDEGPEPTLDEYYQPSDEMKMYTNVVTGVAGSVAGVLVSKMLLCIWQLKLLTRPNFQKDRVNGLTAEQL